MNLQFKRYFIILQNNTQHKIVVTNDSFQCPYIKNLSNLLKNIHAAPLIFFPLLTLQIITYRVHHYYSSSRQYNTLKFTLKSET